MSDRYFVEPPITSDRVTISGSEAHHLINVMRVKRGAKVVLFDGSGAEFSATVEALTRSQVELIVEGREEVDRELPFNLTLGVTLPKGDRQKWLVEKAVELGVGRIVPLKSEWAVAQPVEKALERLNRAVVEASKQCGRNRLMEIAEPMEWGEFVEATRNEPVRLLAHPGDSQSSIGEILAEAKADRVFLAVGPEGGFTEGEVALAVNAGWRRVDLGQRIMRIETAAVFLAAVAVGCRL